MILQEELSMGIQETFRSGEFIGDRRVGDCMILQEELSIGIQETFRSGKFIRDRRAYEIAQENCLRELFPHHLKRCLECSLVFDASRVTTQLFCETCLIQMG